MMSRASAYGRVFFIGPLVVTNATEAISAPIVRKKRIIRMRTFAAVYPSSRAKGEVYIQRSAITTGANISASKKLVTL